MGCFTCFPVHTYSYFLSEDTIEWLNGQLPDPNIPADSSLEDLRVYLQDGTALCQLLNRLRPGAVEMVGWYFHVQF